MASLANHTELPGHKQWVGLLCLSQSTERVDCRQEVKKLWLKHQFPIRHNPGVLAVELRMERYFHPLPVQWPCWYSPGGVTDSDHTLHKIRFSSSLRACEQQGWSHNTPDWRSAWASDSSEGSGITLTSTGRPNSWHGNCKWGRTWARWGEKETTGRETTKGGHEETEWRVTEEALQRQGSNYITVLTWHY